MITAEDILRLREQMDALQDAVPTETEVAAAFEAERVKATAAERDRIRLELLAEAKLLHFEHHYQGEAALRDFARRMEHKP